MRNTMMIAAAVTLAATPAAFAQDAQKEQAAVAEQAPDQATIAQIEAVQAHVDAYRSRDLDRFVATFAPDAQVFANGLTATGHDEIRALYRLNFRSDAPTIRIDESGISNGLVFLSVGYVFANGQEVCCSYSEYEVVNGKITYLATSG